MRLLVLGLLLSVTAPAFAADSADLQNRLDNTVKPFVGKYCVTCHSGPQPTGQEVQGESADTNRLVRISSKRHRVGHVALD